MLMSPEKKRLPMTRTTVIWLCLIALCTTTTFFAFYPDEAWIQWQKFIKVQVVALLTLVLINSRERLRQLIWIIVLSIGFYGAKGGFYVLRTGGETGRVYGPPGGFVSGNNELALALLMILPLMFFLRRHESNVSVRRGLWLLIALTVISILGSFSRGAFLGLLGCGAFLWLKSHKKFPIAVATVIAAVAMLFLMPQSWWDRMGTIETYDQDSSAQGRLDAWRLAVVVANDRPLGGGFNFWSAEIYDSYGVAFIKPQYAHSIYFQMLGEHGWPGLLLFLAMIGATWMQARRLIRQTSSTTDLAWENDLCRMVQVCLVAYMVGGAFLGLAYFDLPYHLVGMVVIVSDYLARAHSTRTNATSPRF